MPAGPPCPSEIPTYYPLTLHIIAGISIPINFIGFYLVWFQSPKMLGYKYCLCYLQFASFLTEMHMSFICPGYYFFPLTGGFNTGGQFISSHLSITIYTFIFSFEVPSTLLCFIYRHNATKNINRGYSSKLYLEKLFLILTHLFPFSSAFCMFQSKLTPQQRMDYVNNNFPQCLEWLKFEAFEVYDYHPNRWLVALGAVVFATIFVAYSYAMTLGVHTMIILQKFRKSMSRQTYQMHKTALFSLIMQIVIPGVLLVAPLSFCMFVIIMEEVGLQELATGSMFFVASHSMCSSAVMILSNPRYRTVLLEKTLKALGLSSVTIAARSGVEPSQNSFAPTTTSVVSVARRASQLTIREF
ncbi:Serpentine Receptor, class I [Caenorhabditis elegans]|uniref:Serpentine Receptor, class I n=1 Tax=Caenorhabditis elegans TaxID=6239 RepID=O62177_CAEEL|nr:Serpentine Receptor, class I [Caenorhabditis elegans]CAB04118.2 Serpentine Receptor, class I [Caenorhabditis elegans]|eukprot:NP_493071.2 Serpentine Receptor, class I [Caenorhabditis elegans]